ncbi:hypothetical protein KFL_001850130 [Klebsormidium nitens]|uniref:Uncharacterized protein n=1 Tax=Klebsormidium nitens TaxID=105231 RepID=A0A1Y1I8A6_KLENI|nr:hypothetical protein KFL_001850130 [Klebsormidium nitens]|eukprot:GAQ84338.1 hypothetical protein KFL_001850130 [Klebsormidium nitens]
MAGSSEDAPAHKPSPPRSVVLVESDIGVPPSRRQSERQLLSSVLSETQEAQGEQIDALLQQMRFLEDQVQRLNAELAQYQAASPGGSLGLGRSPLASPPGGWPRPQPQSLADSDAVTPLMVAYDRRLRDQEEVIEERTARAEELSVQVDALVSENEHLLSEVQRCMHVIQSREAEGAPPGSDSDAMARLELLSRENDLLVDQQRELEAELSRAQGQLTTTTAENNRLQREVAQLLERSQSAAEELERGAKERGSRQEELRQLAEGYDAVIEQVARLKAEKGAAEETAADCRRRLEVAQARFHADVSALEAQTTTAQERARIAADALAAASRDVDAWRERCASSERELAATRREADEARRAAAALEVRLKEYKLKDETAFQNVKKARDEAEEARSERTRGEAKLARAEEAVISLTQRLEAQRTELSNKREADLASHAARAAQALSAAQSEARAAAAECADLHATLDRALRDKRSAAAEMEQLKARAVHLVPGRVEDVSKHAAQLAAATARAEEAEAGRDEALEKVASLSSAAQRSMNDWERERSALLAQAADLGRQLQRVEGELDEKLGVLQQLEMTVDELERTNRALSKGQAKVEKRARDEVQAVRLEKETQVRSLTIKLDDAVALYERFAREAEDVIASKDQLVNRWREEAQQIARSFEAASAEQREEIGRLMARVEDLTNRAQAGQSVIDGQEDEIKGLRQALQALKPAYEALERRVAELSAQLSLAAAREEQLLAARAELRGEVDQMAVARDRSERGRDAAARRCEELTWQLLEAQSAIEGVALSPLQVNLPHSFNDPDATRDAKHKGRRRSERTRGRSREALVT